jgi:subtilisin-like proprotein convertase family protein
LSSINSIVRPNVCLFWGLLTACVVGLASPASAQTAVNGTLLISEFRVRGPNGANDEFVEIYNNTNASHTVTAASGTGYGLAASDGVTRCSIPNGTVLPARGHYLCVNSVGYSLASYPAGSGTTATGNATYTTDIPDNAGIALFNNNTGGGSYSLANRIDAVGSTSEANTLYKEGTGYPALVPFSIDYSFARKLAGGCTGSGGGGNCDSVALMLSTAGPASSNVQDTNNNANDFIFVDTNGTSAGAGQRLGAPGPENTNSPIARDGGSLTASNLDPCGHRYEPPNQVRDFTSDPANNSTFGTLDLRRRFTNSSGVPITRLRFRIVDITTFPSISNVADLRPRTATTVVVTVDRPPCGSGTSNVAVQGTTLEQPPSQPNGSGFNGSLSVGTITPGTPLAAGASVDVRFLLGIQQNGAGRFCVAAETVPATSSQILCAIVPTTDALTFTNSSGIPVPGTGTSGPGNPYPSNITVAGLTGTISKVTVTLKNITHTFPDDLDVLLVGPTGVKLILMSDALGATDLAGQTYTFDSTGGILLPDAATVGSGQYQPTNYGAGDTFPIPAPGAPYLSPAPAGADSLAAFNGQNPNGTWSLYVFDDVGGDTGNIAGGWDLTITTSGLPGVVTTDFNGDGTSDIAVFRPMTGEWFVQNQGTVGWGAAGDIPVAGDYNGDGVTDRAVYRPSTGVWYVHNQGAVVWGAPGDIPVPGDYLGAGSTQRAVYRPSTGVWYVENQAGVVWGAPGDIPVPGDYNGDLVTDVAVYRPSTGTWFVQGLAPVTWGSPGDMPVPADYDGDRAADFAVFRPSTGVWFVHGQAPVAWGSPGDMPVPADYNGDRATDFAVFRPSTGVWFVHGQAPVAWGTAGDLPVPRPETLGDVNWDGTLDVAGYLADFDGNGSSDFAVYQPSTSTWFAQGQVPVAWGAAGDIPVPGDYNGGLSAERAVYRPSSGAWYVEGQAPVVWGAAGDIPVPGDYDGNGKVNIGVYRPSTGEWFVQGRPVVVWGNPGDVPVPGDYDGNGTVDIAVYRPSIGWWFVQGQAPVVWGSVGDIPVPGDYDGNGTVDIGVYRPSSGWWFVQGQPALQWGAAGDLPVPGDFDGNGTVDFAVYRPSTGWWFVWNGAALQWGAVGDNPASRAYVPR